MLHSYNINTYPYGGAGFISDMDKGVIFNDCKFQYNKDLTVSSVSEFQRTVNFKLPKGEM